MLESFVQAQISIFEVIDTKNAIEFHSKARDHRPSELCDHYVWREYQAQNPAEFPCYVPQAAVPPLLYEPFSNLANNLKHGQIEATDLKFAKSFWEMIPNFEAIRTTGAICIFVEEANREELIVRWQGATIPWPLRNLDNVVQPDDRRLFAQGCEANQHELVDVDVVEGAREDANHLAKLKPCIAAATAATGHSKSFVHGDLRLGNVMLRASAIKDEDAPEYEVHILDFDWQESKEQLCILN
ncbi:hypothetical protein SELMODRAFT_428311 [Selaginella moellendorffii]|uniref:Uncharacterized protein n=1 Tax=Selaginella moellendorffii TaxID=88036 RepID=D8T2F0_SELML|nr:hypothetical protein SELMODRAFT_428311 [Selaginella moellendorffii]